MSVEFIAYADVARAVPLSQNRDLADRLGYVLLEVVGRAIFEFLAFSVVTLLWFETAVSSSAAERSQLERLVPLLLIGTSAVLSLVSLWQAIDILSRSEGSSFVYRFHLMVEGLCWGVHAAIAVVCARLTARRIFRLSTLPPGGTLRRSLIFAKPLVPMLMCAICYALRSVWLIIRFLRLPKTSSIPDRFSAAWWIGFVWVPTFIPSIMLLYSARKRDPPAEMEQAHAPLLPTPVPPAEAFISFRRFQHDLLSPLTPNPNAFDDEDTEDRGAKLQQKVDDVERPHEG
jgi:hypothetical protein